MVKTNVKAKVPVQLMAANSLLATEKAGAIMASTFSEGFL